MLRLSKVRKRIDHGLILICSVNVRKRIDHHRLILISGRVMMIKILLGLDVCLLPHFTKAPLLRIDKQLLFVISGFGNEQCLLQLLLPVLGIQTELRFPLQLDIQFILLQL